MELTVNERIGNNINIMKQMKLNDVIEFARNGAAIKQSEDAKGIPISRIETIWNSTIDENRLGYADIYDEDLIKYEKYLLKKNDILITHINSPKHLGKSAIYTGYPEKLIHGMNLLCLRNNPNFSNSKYLFYYFQTKYFKNQILKISNQSVNQASFAVTNLKELEIPIPDLLTQQKIAAILDKADELRQYHKQLIEKYDALTQSLFLEMFGDIKSNSKGWKTTIFENIISLKRGYDLPHNSRIKGNIPVVASTGIVGYHNISKVNTACIVTGRSGSIGKVQLIKQDCWPLNTSLYGYKTFDNNLIYLKNFIEHFNIERFSHGAGVPTLDRKLVHSEIAPIPPIKLQNQFAERVQIIETQKQQTQESLAKSEDLFQGLLQRAFQGELN
ncbi:hypothetical protein EKL98_08615 [Flavobacterium bomense]|uniref:Type I restriction modification DNA specificity domain-containing protein n=1 Tax=Flavobacterium bomense TaxID=2497483 RepID=A0A3S0MD34_9FLAO|nr:restriction endonuclease subunit S [Flavobacterium bomense]RTZ04602.1 hypothetical protein EKL98_08615 [Flavobacterium bomense]